jgi:membrane-bound hydrogenase subunit alpha
MLQSSIEEIGGIHPPPRANYIRTLIAELERIHSHMLWLGVTAYGVGFDTFFMYAMRIREQILDIFEEVTGNRVHHSINTIGGIRADLKPPAYRQNPGLYDLKWKKLHNTCLKTFTAKQ